MPVRVKTCLTRSLEVDAWKVSFVGIRPARLTGLTGVARLAALTPKQDATRNSSNRTRNGFPVSRIRCMNRALSSDTALVLTGDNLTLPDAARILHGQVGQLQVAPAARRRVEQARRCLHDLLAQGATLYGVNTGFGKLASQRIELS